MRLHTCADPWLAMTSEPLIVSLVQWCLPLRMMLTDFMAELAGDDGRPGGALLRQVCLLWIPAIGSHLLQPVPHFKGVYAETV